MYLTERDNKILCFIEEYGGITIEICNKIFFHELKFGYPSAARRLKIMHKNRLLKKRKNIKNENVYYSSDKPISLHATYLLRLYAELVSANFKILNFEREFRIGSEYRIDGLIEIGISMGDKLKHLALAVEIDLNHSGGFERLENIYESNVLQEYFKNKYRTNKAIFPTFIICSRALPRKERYSENFNINYITFEELNNVKDLVIEAVL